MRDAAVGRGNEHRRPEEGSEGGRQLRGRPGAERAALGAEGRPAVVVGEPAGGTRAKAATRGPRAGPLPRRLQLPPRRSAHRVRVGVEVLEGESAEHKTREHRRRALPLHVAAAAALLKGAGRRRGLKSGGRGRATMGRGQPRGRGLRPRTGCGALRRGRGRGGAGALWWVRRCAALRQAFRRRGVSAQGDGQRFGGSLPPEGASHLYKTEKGNSAGRIEALFSDIISRWKCHFVVFQVPDAPLHP